MRKKYGEDFNCYNRDMPIIFLSILLYYLFVFHAFLRYISYIEYTCLFFTDHKNYHSLIYFIYDSSIMLITPGRRG